MRIVVKNNEPVKAYKVLMKKLKKEGVFQELYVKSFFRSKSQKRKEKHKCALIREKKRKDEREQELARSEQRLVYTKRK